ncbi:MAG: hypothetical protein MSK40_05935 [Parabacteroides sp.]|nr:hypothetical protein [Parabacteroides sp.]
MEKETNRVQEDRLKSLFKQMPAVSLSEGFRSQMMQRIEKEAVRKRKRQAWLEWSMLILSSTIMIVAAVLGLKELEIPVIRWPQIDTSLLFIYTDIGSIALFLLWLDYRFRRWYDKKHGTKEK